MKDDNDCCSFGVYASRGEILERIGSVRTAIEAEIVAPVLSRCVEDVPYEVWTEKYLGGCFLGRTRLLSRWKNGKLVGIDRKNQQSIADLEPIPGE